MQTVYGIQMAEFYLANKRAVRAAESFYLFLHDIIRLKWGGGREKHEESRNKSSLSDSKRRKLNAGSRTSWRETHSGNFALSHISVTLRHGGRLVRFHRVDLSCDQTGAGRYWTQATGSKESELCFLMLIWIIMWMWIRYESPELLLSDECILPVKYFIQWEL